MAETLVDSLTGGTAVLNDIYTDGRPEVGQSFTGNGGKLNRITFNFYRNSADTSSANGSLRAKIYAHTGTFGSTGTPTGTALAVSQPFQFNNIQGATGLVDYSFYFTGANRITLTDATNYFVVIETTGILLAGTTLRNYGYTTSNHAGNYATFNGTTWTANATSDMNFKVYSDPIDTSHLDVYDFSGSVAALRDLSANKFTRVNTNHFATNGTGQLQYANFQSYHQYVIPLSRARTRIEYDLNISTRTQHQQNFFYTDTTYTNGYYVMWEWGGSGYPWLQIDKIGTNAKTLTYRFLTTAEIPTNVNFHVTMDFTEGHIRCYLNGVLYADVIETTYTGNLHWRFDFTTGLMDNLVVNSSPTISARAFIAHKFTRHRTITIPGSKIGHTGTHYFFFKESGQTEFKAIVNGGKMNVSGYDIVFSENDVTTGAGKLPYERINHNVSSGDTIYWVRVNVTAGVSKTIYVLYAETGTPKDHTNKGMVWGDDFLGVYHLNDAMDSGTTQNRMRSSSLARFDARVSAGSINYPFNAGGTPIMGYGKWLQSSQATWWRYEGTDSANSDWNFGNITPYFSIQEIICVNGVWNDGFITGKDSNAAAGHQLRHYQTSGEYINWWDNADVAYGVNTGLNPDQTPNVWHYYSYGRDTDSYMKVARDVNLSFPGSREASAPQIRSTTTPWTTGAFSPGNGYTTDLYIAEIRFKKTFNTYNQQTTEYNNYIDKTNFYTLGSGSGWVTTTTKTTTAKARIKLPTIKTATAKSRIINTGQTKTVSAKSDIRLLDVSKTVSGLARVKFLARQQTATSKASVVLVLTKSVQAKARVISPMTKTITALARVVSTGITKTITAKARIIFLAKTKTITAKASIAFSATKTISAKARIAVDRYERWVRLDTDHARVYQDINDYVLRVDVTDALLKTVANGGLMRSTAANDLIIGTGTNQDSKLPFEIEHYDAVNGRIRGWVKIPTIYNLKTTYIFVTWGNPARTGVSQQNVSGTWPTANKAVWHLANTTDSTGTLTLTNTGVSFVSGQIYNAGAWAYLEGDRMQSNSTSLAGGWTQLTLMGWIRTTETRENNYLMVKCDSGVGSLVFGLRIGNGPTTMTAIEGWVSNNGSAFQKAATANGAITPGAWTHIAFVYNGTNPLRLYKDGNEVTYATQNNGVSSLYSTTQPIYLGYIPGWGTSGQMDELRIVNQAYSANEIRTIYQDQYNKLTSNTSPLPLTERNISAKADIFFERTKTITARANIAKNIYEHYQEIDISKAYVIEDRSYHLIHFDITKTQLKRYNNGGEIYNSSGYDIILSATTNPANKLYFERMLYDSAIGRWVVWARVPNIQKLRNQRVFLLWGNRSHIYRNYPPQDITNTWTSDYRLVDHNEITVYDSSNYHTTGSGNGVSSTTARFYLSKNFTRASSQSTAFFDDPDIDLGTNNFQASAWVRPHTQVMGVVGTIMGKYQDGGMGWTVFKYSDNYPGFYINTTVGGNLQIATSDQLVVNTWHYVVVQRRGATDRRIYINGHQATTAAQPSATGSVDNANSLRIGAYDTVGGGSAKDFWDGEIDEARVKTGYDSDNVILQDYTFGINSPILYGNSWLSTHKQVQAQARIQAAPIKNITAKARVIATGRGKTISALARVDKASVSKTITAKSRVHQSYDKSVTARARILSNVNKTIEAKSRVIFTGVVKAVTALANVKNYATKTIAGKADIKQSGVVKTVSAEARIETTGEKSVTSKARIILPTIKTIEALTRVKNSGTKIIESKARVIFTGNEKLIDALARIFKSETKTSEAKSRIRLNKEKTIDTQAKIKLQLPKSIEAKAFVKKIISQVVSAKANLLVKIEQQKTISAKATIVSPVYKTISAKASILIWIRRTKTIRALAYIFSPTKVRKTISAKAEIRTAGTQTTTVQAKAYIIKFNVTKTISAKAKVGQPENNIVRMTPGIVAMYET